MESATPWVQALWAKNWQSKHLTHTYFCIVVCKVCQAQNAYIFINRGVQILLVIGLYGLYACLLGFPYFAPFQTADFLYVFFSFLSSSASACFPDVPEDSWTSHLPCPTESLSWSCLWKWMESRLPQSSSSRGGLSWGVLLILLLMVSEVSDKDLGLPGQFLRRLGLACGPRWRLGLPG